MLKTSSNNSDIALTLSNNIINVKDIVKQQLAFSTNLKL